MLIFETRTRTGWRTGEDERKREKERGNRDELMGEGEGKANTEGGSGGTSNEAE